ncbi:TIGR03943 family protein [Paenibacillus sp. YPG26]|uniref:TIGR03943 family putative permease subunit n=1 Tax=Paenibacillus sp. YPG26 TaxID=2878915 RepID=UPI00203F27F6|nr:TIGR03943 family protein [Paenibacillus sp. YPG26]USB31881.1 TIGR03943 family protein [Paenibacillus sp. YPG26]
MNKPSLIRAHNLTRAVILLGLAIYIYHLDHSESLHYYIAPRMEFWVSLCPAPLACIALSLLIQAFLVRKRSICDCTTLPSSAVRNAAVYGIFTIPLLLGFLLPNQALGSAAALKKGMTLSRQYLTEQTLKEKFKSPDIYNEEFAELARLLYAQPVIQVNQEIFYETIGAIDLFKQEFEGKPIRLSGFVYSDPSLDRHNAFALGRFLVLCCTADAAPFGVYIKPEEPVNLPQDTWVEIEGHIHVTRNQGKEIASINAVQIREIKQPKTPYIYPSDNSVDKLRKELASIKR